MNAAQYLSIYIGVQDNFDSTKCHSFEVYNKLHLVLSQSAFRNVVLQTYPQLQPQIPPLKTTATPRSLVRRPQSPRAMHAPRLRRCVGLSQRHHRPL